MDLFRRMYSPHASHTHQTSRATPVPWGFSPLSLLWAWKAALRAEEAYENATARGRPRDAAAVAAFIALIAKNSRRGGGE